MPSTRSITIIGLIISVALYRIAPHPFNFTPIGAMALFGGAHFRRSFLGFAVPMFAMFLSDVFIGFHDTIIYVYVSIVLMSLIGKIYLKNVTFNKVVVSSVASSVLFFLITNFAVWFGSSFYPQNLSGLLGCYAAGLAFYQNSLFGNLFMNTVMGDLFYSGLLFGAFELLQKRFPVLATA